MKHSFHTVKKEAKSEYRDRGSKFFGLVFPLKERADVDSVLRHCKENYYDAGHHCYAFQLNPDGSEYLSSDDGEPSHSAGDPILGQIRSLNLTNTMVVVVRYFGGTKLGVPGLIEAYKSAAADALLLAGKKKVFICDHFDLEYPYESTSEIEQLIHNYELKAIHREFTATCKVTFAVPVQFSDLFNNSLETLDSRGLIKYFEKKAENVY